MSGYDPSQYRDRGNVKWKMQFLLPEHRERLNQWYKEQDKKEKPEFDEQLIEELSMKISEAQHEQYRVMVCIFSEQEDIEIIGRITRIDRQSQRILIDNEYEYPLWVNFGDLVSVEPAP